MKKYNAPEIELLTLGMDVIMASGEDVPGVDVAGSENQTAKDYIADLVVENIDNI